MADAEFQSRLDALVGRPMGRDGLAPDPVNQPMIRHWAAAFEDVNPVYVDRDAAAASRFGEIVAPPMMLAAWTMATPKITGMAERGGAAVEIDDDSPLRLLDDAGFTGTLAANSEFEIDRYLRLGEVLRSSTTIESISEEKQTRLGRGHFITWVTAYIDDAGEPVGRHRFRILKFQPPGAPS